ncbi:MAG: 30S ribosomal protein S6 [bacterium]
MSKVENVEKEGGVQVYELGYHIVSTVAEENLPKELEVIKAIILKDGGSLITEGEPKLINLAYEMSKTVSDIKKKFNTAYFGWIKFETKSELIPEIKKAVDADNSILRYLLIKTVKENTMTVPRIFEQRGESKPIKKAPKEEVKEAPASIEDIDKSIDEMVSDQV